VLNVVQRSVSLSDAQRDNRIPKHERRVGRSQPLASRRATPRSSATPSPMRPRADSSSVRTASASSLHSGMSATRIRRCASATPAVGHIVITRTTRVNPAQHHASLPSTLSSTTNESDRCKLAGCAGMRSPRASVTRIPSKRPSGSRRCMGRGSRSSSESERRRANRSFDLSLSSRLNP
jgi:hypothetical protein